MTSTITSWTEQLEQLRLTAIEFNSYAAAKEVSKALFYLRQMEQQLNKAKECYLVEMASGMNDIDFWQAFTLHGDTFIRNIPRTISSLKKTLDEHRSSVL